MRATARGVALMLAKQAGGAPQAFARAAKIAAERIRGDLVRKTPADQGVMRNAWKVLTSGGVTRVENDAPHAGIIEEGARPHPVSREGVAALTSWVIRKGYADDEKSAAPIVWGIVQRLKTKGQKGLFIARDLLPTASRYLGEEFAQQLAASRPEDAE